jgi:UDP-3-O-[3-hydroxymyristoyl] glucosamine N-acyltransferase
MSEQNLKKFINKKNIYNLGSVESKTLNTLTYADKQKYLLIALNNVNINCIITSKELARNLDTNKEIIVSEYPRRFFYEIHEYLIVNKIYKIPFQPQVGKNFMKHKSSFIHTGSSIGNNVKIDANVVIKEPVHIGSNVNIGTGANIGIDGILYYKLSNKIIPINHAGYVKISDNVNIMSGAKIIRSINPLIATEIGEGSLIGMNTIIGHESKISKRVIISNKCLIARNSIIEDDAYIGTGSIVKENIVVGKKAKVMAGSVVIENVHAGRSVSGNFAIDHKKRMLEFSRQNK